MAAGGFTKEWVEERMLAEGLTQRPPAPRVEEVEEPPWQGPINEELASTVRGGPRPPAPRIEEVEEPKVEEPNVEDPKVEDPKIEEPKVEELVDQKAEEPVAEVEQEDIEQAEEGTGAASSSKRKDTCVRPGRKRRELSVGIIPTLR